jgi:hypothetical protein
MRGKMPFVDAFFEVGAAADDKIRSSAPLSSRAASKPATLMGRLTIGPQVSNLPHIYFVARWEEFHIL